MENESLLSSQSNTPHQSQDDRIIENENEDEEITTSQIPQSHPISGETSQPLLSSNSRWKSTLHRSRTAPALPVIPDGDIAQQRPQQQLLEPGSIYIQATFFLFLYLSIGISIYCFNREHFSGVDTNSLVDALYFSIVTMCTIGYGDIAPLTPAAKLFDCIFVLLGFGFLDVLLTNVVHRVLALQENAILGSNILANDYVVDAQKGRMRIRMKVGLALFAVVFCIGSGTLALLFLEGLNWTDSFYISVMSVTTVGYGDKAFKTLPGRLFASAWLLVSTLLVAHSFMYLAEMRVGKRRRGIANLVLQKEITVQDLLAADVNNNGSVSKSEFLLYKLKEMGKISENDVLQIGTQFSKLDPDNSGKIKLSILTESSR